MTKTSIRLAQGLIAAVLIMAPGAKAAPAVQPLPPSIPSIDAPELARLGPFDVGVRSITLSDPDQPDAAGKPRGLLVDIWYPAKAAPGAARVVYADTMPMEAIGKDAAFTVPGIAVRGAAPAHGGPYPLVILAHGYSGTPAAMTWLAENLASKGYVVAAAHHRDPPYGDASGAGSVAFHRPLDIAFVAHTLQARARAADPFLAGLADPTRVVLAGYSMGGYGVLTVAGATLDPAAARAASALAPYARGGAKVGSLAIDGLKAVVAISPAGGPGARTWGAEGLAGLRVPLLISVGSQDKVVGYEPVKAIYDGAIHAPRYLLVFQGGGHSIGMNGAPPQMRGMLWDQDWFEDPVWRKERVIGVQLHIITAFLDRYVKGDESRAAYLDVATPIANDAVWPPRVQDKPYGVFSSGTGGVTVWKGFQRSHFAGLELHYTPAQP
jgi:predicted dienelactone hydrolase